MDPGFDPQQIRSPIQLTAVWFVAMVILVGALLTAAANPPARAPWLGPVFGISAVAIIPLFLFAVFRLQTRYRPQLLADEYFVETVQRASQARGFELPPDEPARLSRRAVRNREVVVQSSILWVDDHPEWNETERDMLQRAGIQRVDAVTSTEVALQQLAERRYDVIISDMERDGNNRAGLDLIRMVRGHGVPVIIYLENLDRSRGVPADALGITNRPDELLDLVLDGIERSR